MEKIKENLKYIVLGVIILFMMISVISYIKVDDEVMTKDETIKKDDTVNKVTGKYYVDIKKARIYCLFIVQPRIYNIKRGKLPFLFKFGHG